MCEEMLLCYDTAIMTILEIKTLVRRHFCVECHVDPDEDDAGGVEMMRCWQKLGNYIDRGSLREGGRVIQKETVGNDLRKF